MGLQQGHRYPQIRLLYLCVSRDFSGLDDLLILYSTTNPYRYSTVASLNEVHGTPDSIFIMIRS